MRLPDRSDALMFDHIDRAEAAGQRVDDARARLLKDPARLARLIVHRGPFTLCGWLADALALSPEEPLTAERVADWLRDRVNPAGVAFVPPHLDAALERFLAEQAEREAE